MALARGIPAQRSARATRAGAAAPGVALTGSAWSRRALRLAVASRVGAAVLGGYAFAWGLVAATTSLCVAAGMGFHDAEFLSSLLGVLAYLAAFLWAAAARRLWPVWWVLGGSGVALAALASAVQAALVRGGVP